ncbi:MAG: M15 family metallopeptidase, partial [Bacteroidota bacterium]
LQLLLAYQAGEEPPAYRTSQPVSPARARQLSARYQADDGRSVRLIEQSGALLFDDGEIRTPVERDGLYELVTNGRLGVGRTLRLVNDGQGGPQDLIIDGTRFARQYDRVPEPAPEHFNELIGEYGPDHNVLHVLEEDGQLTVLIEWFFRYPLTPIEEDRYAFPGRGLYAGEEVIFLRDETGAITGVEAANVVWPRRAVGPDDGATFKIDPIRPVEELREEALRATPPAENGPFRPAALVDVTQQPAVIDGDTLALEPGIKLDVRYATTNNFMGAAFYDKPRALLQKPAAEALARVHFNLRALGYGLLVHDAYRPWHVTKMFWDATPQDLKLFVANPARGSRHNRGAAVDLTLYDLTTGEPIAMPSGFDEFSPRAYAAYPGGTSAQRWHRALLRRVMELEGFRVLNAEWWHFDYKDWREYGLGNVGF